MSVPRTWTAVVVFALAATFVVAPANAQQDTRDTPGWFGYDRDPEWDAIVETITVEMDDGVPIACDLYRPGLAGTADPGPFPALMMDVVPYGKAGFSDDATFFTQRGYVTMACEVRGSGSSGGDFDPLNARELADNVALIEWLGDQPDVNGRVGQKGFSYGGVSSYRVAGAQPRHLVAVAPGAAYTDWYRDWIYLGGARNGDVRTVQGVFVGTAPGPGAAQLEADWSAHPTYDAYWRERSIRELWDTIDVPVLGWGGHYDLFPEGMLANASALHDHHWYVVGPWQHETDSVVPFPLTALLAWFDHWVMELPGAPLPDDRFTVFELPADDDASWVTYPTWPPPTVADRRLYFTADGGLTDAPGPAGTIAQPANPGDPDPTSPFGGARPDAVNQALAEVSRATFSTDPLDSDLTVAGSIDVTLRATISGADANLVVRLVDVAPDGTATRVTSGWLKATHLRSAPHHTAAGPLDSGRAHDFPIRLWATHHTFRAGHQLRLSVSGGDVPRLQPDGSSATITLATGEGGSSAEVPVLGGRPTGQLSVEGVAASTPDLAGEVSTSRFERADTVVLARRDDYADGLAGGPLATLLDAPILLTSPTRLDADTERELERLAPEEVVILGGAAAMSDAVVVQAAAASGGAVTRRLAGANRFATAAAIAGELPPTGRVLVVEGEHADPTRGWPDALSAGGLAVVDRSPILLVNRDRLPAETVAAIEADDGATEAIIVGGLAAVSADVEHGLAAVSDGVNRIQGADRYETSTAAATAAVRRGAIPTDLIVVTGEDWRDGLAASAAVGAANGVLLLSSADPSPSTIAWTDRFRPRLRDVLLLGEGAGLAAHLRS